MIEYDDKGNPRWMKFDIEFNYRRNKIKFSIIHCIGNFINSAFENWIVGANSKEYNAKSFVKYINSKFTPEVVAYTEHQFNKLCNYAPNDEEL